LLQPRVPGIPHTPIMSLASFADKRCQAAIGGARGHFISTSAALRTKPSEQNNDKE
jgi:hypothetical protein